MLTASKIMFSVEGMYKSWTVKTYSSHNCTKMQTENLINALYTTSVLAASQADVLSHRRHRCLQLCCFPSLTISNTAAAAVSNSKGLIKIFCCANRFWVSSGNPPPTRTPKMWMLHLLLPEDLASDEATCAHGKANRSD